MLIHYIGTYKLYLLGLVDFIGKIPAEVLGINCLKLCCILVIAGLPGSLRFREAKTAATMVQYYFRYYLIYQFES